MVNAWMGERGYQVKKLSFLASLPSWISEKAAKMVILLWFVNPWSWNYIINLKVEWIYINFILARVTLLPFSSLLPLFTVLFFLKLGIASLVLLLASSFSFHFFLSQAKLSYLKSFAFFLVRLLWPTYSISLATL